MGRDHDLFQGRVQRAPPAHATFQTLLLRKECLTLRSNSGLLLLLLQIII